MYRVTITEQIRRAKQYAQIAQEKGEKPDNREGFIKANLRVVECAEQALGQLNTQEHVHRELYGAGSAEFETLRDEILALSATAQRAILESL